MNLSEVDGMVRNGVQHVQIGVRKCCNNPVAGNKSTTLCEACRQHNTSRRQYTATCLEVMVWSEMLCNLALAALQASCNNPMR
jgi:hypothetical protein